MDPELLEDALYRIIDVVVRTEHPEAGDAHHTHTRSVHEGMRLGTMCAQVACQLVIGKCVKSAPALPFVLAVRTMWSSHLVVAFLFTHGSPLHLGRTAPVFGVVAAPVRRDASIRTTSRPRRASSQEQGACQRQDARSQLQPPSA
jgi:hypothetical protein